MCRFSGYNTVCFKTCLAEEFWFSVLSYLDPVAFNHIFIPTPEDAILFNWSRIGSKRFKTFLSIIVSCYDSSLALYEGPDIFPVGLSPIAIVTFSHFTHLIRRLLSNMFDTISKL